MFCFIFLLVYPSTLYIVYTGLYLIGSWILSKKTIDATLDRCDFVVPLVSMLCALILILSLCGPAGRILRAAFAWPLWTGLPTYVSLAFATIISIVIGVFFYFLETIAARAWLKLRMGNKPIVKRWMFGETKRIVRQGQKLPIGLLLVCIFSEVILEEILWRGYLVSYATDVLNIPIQYSIIIASFAFGMNHLSYGFANVISKTLFGVILSIMYIAFDSLLPSILCHQVFNLMVFKIRIEWKS